VKKVDLIQGTFFGDSVLEKGADYGFSTKTVSCVTGLSLRQLGDWDKKGYVSPSLKSAKGSGSKRLYSFKDVVVLKVYAELIESGMRINKIQLAVSKLQELGVYDLAATKLVTDGKTVFLVKSESDVIDLLRNGQGAFFADIHPIWTETESILRDFPAEKVVEEFVPKAIQEYNEYRERVKQATSGF
jgi:DNA-binding transcriptional MerR regulator